MDTRLNNLFNYFADEIIERGHQTSDNRSNKTTKTDEFVVNVKFQEEVEKLCAVGDYFFYNEDEVEELHQQQQQQQNLINAKKNTKINITSKSIKKAGKANKRHSK